MFQCLRHCGHECSRPRVRYGPIGGITCNFYYVFGINECGCVIPRGSYRHYGETPWTFLCLRHWWTWVGHPKELLRTWGGNPSDFVNHNWGIDGFGHGCVRPRERYDHLGGIYCNFSMVEALLSIQGEYNTMRGYTLEFKTKIETLMDVETNVSSQGVDTFPRV